MPKWTEDMNKMPAAATTLAIPRVLTLEQVQEILNVKASLVYSLVRSGELPAGQFGGRGIWRVREGDLLAYITQRSQKQLCALLRVRSRKATSPRKTEPAA